MARLRVEYADGRRTDVALDAPEVVIGRDETCDVTLDDTITSRRHARLYRDAGGHYWIEDMRSKNGTLLNEQPVVSARLKDGDRLLIGACVVRLELAPGGAVRPRPVLGETQLGQTSAWGIQERLQLPRKRLERLYELNERLTGLFDRDELLTEVLDICMNLLRFERAGIAVWRGEPHPPQWVRFLNVGGGVESEVRISDSLVERALHKAERIVVNDTASGAYNPTASMISNNIRSAMCVPMAYHDKVRGVVYGDRISSTGGYTREDIDFFAALGRLGAMGLANVQLVDEMRQRQQVEMQLQWARQVQSHLCPTEPLAVGGLTIDALNDPGQRVSGDYYDYYLRDDERVVLIIADVSGKGVPASLLMANMQAAIHVILAEETDLERAASALNDLICRNVGESRFITALFGLIDVESRVFEYVNAGHHAPFLLYGDGRLEEVEVEPCLPLGVEADCAYSTGRIALDKGQTTLFLYTDGVPDAQNEAGDSFGEDRLRDALAASVKQPPADLVARIRRSIKQFTRNHLQTDDITMVAAHFDG